MIIFIAPKSVCEYPDTTSEFDWIIRIAGINHSDQSALTFSPEPDMFTDSFFVEHDPKTVVVTLEFEQQAVKRLFVSRDSKAYGHAGVSADIFSNCSLRWALHTAHLHSRGMFRGLAVE